MPTEKERAFFAAFIAWIKENGPTKEQLAKQKPRLCKRFGRKRIPTDIEILLHAGQQEQELLRPYLTTKPVRTGSGVAVVAVMAKPYACPHGKCTFCPGGPGSVFGDTPQSYTGREPSTMRGFRNRFEPYHMVFNRLEQYIVLGQSPEKVELIIQGGTFPAYPTSYQETFVMNLFKAMNDFSTLFYRKGALDIERFRHFFELPGSVKDDQRKARVRRNVETQRKKRKTSLAREQRKNETAMVRCVGLTIETKPDWGMLTHGDEMLKLGCTRIELGVQQVYDKVLEATHRGHTVADTKRSVQVLRDLGFKLNFHLMPGLPGLTETEDKEGLAAIFEDEVYRPDMVKLYPTLVMPGTVLYQQYKRGLYQPLSTEEAANRIADFKRQVPEYCRIMRVQRDIPTGVTEAGPGITNLRQEVQRVMEKHGWACRCIRCREVGDAHHGPARTRTLVYDASGGTEHFIQCEANDKIIGFCRLRIPSMSLRKEITERSALIRELHVYGTATGLGREGVTQHRGIGRRLLREAERQAAAAHKNKIVVISGVGVRSYYRTLGYRRQGPYMIKHIKLR